MAPIGCSETSVRKYHNSLRNKPEERSFRVNFVFPFLTKLQFGRQILVKIPDVKLHENLTSESHVVQTDRRMNRHVKVIIVFLSFARVYRPKSGDQRRHGDACGTAYQKTAKIIDNYCS